MASERSAFVNYAIIGLLLVNVGLTAFSIFGDGGKRIASTTHAENVGSAEMKLEVKDAHALALANGVVALYNARDNAGLYARFDPLAKAQLTQAQLDEQLSKLYPVMGSVSDVAFSNVALAGSDGGREYYHLNYKVRLAGGPFSTGDMRLTVTPRDDELGLVGFFINGVSQHSGQ